VPEPLAVQINVPDGAGIALQELMVVHGSFEFEVSETGSAEVFGEVLPHSLLAATQGGAPYALAVSRVGEDVLELSPASSALATLFLVLVPGNLSEEVREDLLEGWAVLPETLELAAAFESAHEEGENPFLTDDEFLQASLGQGVVDAVAAAREYANEYLSQLPGYEPVYGMGGNGDPIGTVTDEGFIVSGYVDGSELWVTVKNTVARNGIILVNRVSPQQAHEIYETEIGGCQLSWTNSWLDAEVTMGPFPLWSGPTYYEIVAIAPSWLEPVVTPPYADEYNWTVMVFFWENGLKPGLNLLAGGMDLGCVVENVWSILANEIPDFLSQFPPSFGSVWGFVDGIWPGLAECALPGLKKNLIFGVIQGVKNFLDLVTQLADIGAGLITFVASLEPITVFSMSHCLPYCGLATCGDNLCGGSCGECGNGYSCSNGQCLLDCIPNTAIKCHNGDLHNYDSCDNLGGVATTCLWGCVEGSTQCGACVPQCNPPLCGPDPICGSDCGPCCPNGACDNGENCSTCPQDCACATCPNGVCDNNETCASCSDDCGACPTCPNGACDNGETCGTCPQDCPCGPECGNGQCEEGEDCETCEQDCAPCCTEEVPDYKDNDCDGLVDEDFRRTLYRRSGGNGKGFLDPQADADHCLSFESGGSAKCVHNWYSGWPESYSHDGHKIRLYKSSIGSGHTAMVGTVMLVRLAECYSPNAHEHQYWTTDSSQYDALVAANWQCGEVGYVKTGAPASGDSLQVGVRRHVHVVATDTMYSVVPGEASDLGFVDKGVAWFAWEVP